MPEANHDYAVQMQIPGNTLTNSAVFIRTVREGIPGVAAKVFVEACGDSTILSKILGVSLSDVAHVYHCKKLGSDTSEELLDAMRIFVLATDVFGNKDIAREWLNTRVPALNNERPLDLFDTFEGRKWVSQVLNAIKWGEFS